MAGPQISDLLGSFKAFIGLAPRRKPRFIPVLLDFTLQTSYTIDLAVAFERDMLEFVQFIYVDNSAGTAPLVCTCEISNQPLTWRAGMQGYLPVLAPGDKFTFTCSGGSANTWVYFLSFPVPAATWQTNSLSGFAVETALPSAAYTNGAGASPGMSSSGILIELPYSAPELTLQYSTNGTPITTNTSTAIFAAAGANVRNYMTGIYLANSSATTGTEIQILDGTTVIYDGYLGATTTSLCLLNDDFETPLRGSANTAMNLKTLTTGASIYASAQGYKAY